MSLVLPYEVVHGCLSLTWACRSFSFWLSQLFFLSALLACNFSLFNAASPAVVQVTVQHLNNVMDVLTSTNLYEEVLAWYSGKGRMCPRLLSVCTVGLSCLRFLTLLLF